MSNPTSSIQLLGGLLSMSPASGANNLLSMDNQAVSSSSDAFYTLWVGLTETNLKDTTLNDLQRQTQDLSKTADGKILPLELPKDIIKQIENTLQQVKIGDEEALEQLVSLLKDSLSELKEQSDMSMQTRSNVPLSDKNPNQPSGLSNAQQSSRLISDDHQLLAYLTRYHNLNHDSVDHSKATRNDSNDNLLNLVISYLAEKVTHTNSETSEELTNSLLPREFTQPISDERLRQLWVELDSASKQKQVKLERDSAQFEFSSVDQKTAIEVRVNDSTGSASVGVDLELRQDKSSQQSQETDKRITLTQSSLGVIPFDGINLSEQDALSDHPSYPQLFQPKVVFSDSVKDAITKKLPVNSTVSEERSVSDQPRQEPASLELPPTVTVNLASNLMEKSPVRDEEVQVSPVRLESSDEKMVAGQPRQEPASLELPSTVTVNLASNLMEKSPGRDEEVQVSPVRLESSDEKMVIDQPRQEPASSELPPTVTVNLASNLIEKSPASDEAARVLQDRVEKVAENKGEPRVSPVSPMAPINSSNVSISPSVKVTSDVIQPELTVTERSVVPEKMLPDTTRRLLADAVYQANIEKSSVDEKIGDTHRRQEPLMTATPVTDSSRWVQSPASPAQSPVSQAYNAQDALMQKMLNPAWSRALGERAVMMAQQGPRLAEVRLDPPELGVLRIRVQVHGNDQVSLTFNTPSASVREVLEQSLPRLREMFVEQGMNLADASVSDQSNQQQSEQAQSREGNRADSKIKEEFGELPANRTELRKVGIIDYYA